VKKMKEEEERGGGGRREEGRKAVQALPLAFQSFLY
jgi:hypothetical protein